MKYTIAGVMLLVGYVVAKILEFYGINVSAYGSYFAFYIFLIVCSFVLPNEYSSIVQ
jgi:hypothetical protein